MEVKLSLEGVLSDAQCNQIKELLAGLTDDPIAAFCRAAVAESADAILTRRQDSTSNTPLQRLYRLIKHALGGKIPSEAVVSRIFGTTERRAISMISIVSKRYISDFQQGWIDAVKAAFDAKEEAKDEQGAALYRFNAPQAVIEYLRETIAGLSAGRLAPVRKVKDTAELYEIRKDTHDAVCKKLVIPAKRAK